MSLSTSKSLTLVAVAPLSSTVTLPVVASAGIITVSCVEVEAVTVAEVPFIFTTFSLEIVLKLVPVITNEAPGNAPGGTKLVIVGEGNTMKSVVDVAVNPFTVTVIFPVVPPCGTAAVS